MADRQTVVALVVLAVVIGLFGLLVLLADTGSLDEALVAGAAIGLAFALGLPFLELRRRIGPGPAHFETFPIPRVNLRGVLTVAGIVPVSIGWLLTGFVLGTVIATLLENSPLEPEVVGLVAFMVVFGTMIGGTVLTWEWFRRRIR